MTSNLETFQQKTNILKNIKNLIKKNKKNS